MKGKFIIWMMLLMPACSIAQQLAGTVLFQNQPIAGVTIHYQHQHQITDQQGNFKFNSIKPNGILSIDAIGFKEVKKKVSSADSSLIIHLEPLSNELQEVVVTGSLKPIQLAKSITPVGVLNASFFLKNNAQNLVEALANVNGIRSQVTCNVCNTAEIRINGLEGPYTMITIDGMPIVNALGTVYGLSGIPTSILEKIEVVKGPVSTLYGSEAVAGVINLVTKNVLNAPKWELALNTSTYGENNISFSNSSSFKKVHVLTAVQYVNQSSKWDKNKDGFTDVSLQNQIAVFNKWSWNRKQNRVANMAWRYYNEDRWGGELDWNKTFRGGDVKYGESIYTKRFEWLSQYQLPISEKIIWQNSFVAHHQDAAYGNNLYLGKQQVGFSQLYWNKILSPSSELLAGVTTRYNFYDDNSVVTEENINGKVFNKPDVSWMPGAFIQPSFQLNQHHQLQIGARLDYHPKHQWIFSPSINLKSNWKDDNTLRLSFGKGFRVVNLFTEDHAALTGSREVIIVNALRPEQSYNFNLNWQTHWHHPAFHTNFESSMFLNYFTNKIIPDYFSNPSQVIYDNLKGFAITRGVTVNTYTTFQIPITFNTSVTWMQAYSKADKSNQRTPIVQTPNLMANTLITYKNALHQWWVDMNLSYTGKMHMPLVENDPRPATSEPFTLMQIQFSKKYQHLEYSIGVKNVFNFLPILPILRPADPFDKDVQNSFGNDRLNPPGLVFDAAYSYAPMLGRRIYTSVKINL